MISFLVKPPKKINLAFSGGVDSLAVAHFLKRGKFDVTLLHFNHGCEYSNRIMEECKEHAKMLDLPIVIGNMSDYGQDRAKGQSLEDCWRRARYRFLRGFGEKFISAHHLSDAVETWIFSSLHGQSKLIPIQDELVIRPFLTTEKVDFEYYAKKNNLIAVDDPYNRDNHLTRNYIRANIMEHAYHVNPGLKKVIRKKYLELIKCV